MSLLTKNDKTKIDPNAALAEAVEWVDRQRRSNLQGGSEYGQTQALISIAASLREIAQKIK